MVAVAGAIEGRRIDPEVAVAAPEHVFFLRHRAFHIGTAGHFGVRHIEHREAPAVAGGHRRGDLTPVAGHHR